MQLIARNGIRLREGKLDDYVFQIPSPRLASKHFYGIRFKPYYFGVHFLDPVTLRTKRKDTLCGQPVPDPQNGHTVTIIPRTFCEIHFDDYRMCQGCISSAKFLVIQTFLRINELSEEERIGPYGRRIGLVAEFDNAFVKVLKLEAVNSMD